ncbi:MAG: Ig-like domain-containing protein [Actinomycetota bacterium]
MLKRVKLGARSLTLVVCLTTAVGAVGVMPAYAAEAAPTVHLEDGNGDNWLNAAEISAGLYVNGTYSTTAGITHVVADVAVATAPTCANSTQLLPYKIVAAGGTGTFHIGPFDATGLEEGAYLCGRARVSDHGGAPWNGDLGISDNVAQKDTVIFTPSVVIDTDPITGSNVTAVSISVTGGNGDTAALSLTDSGTGSIVSTVALTGSAVTVSKNASSLADGTITATVRSTDPAGNTSSTASDAASKDTVSPDGTVYFGDSDQFVGPAEIQAQSVPVGWKENAGASAASAEVWFEDAAGNMPTANCGRWSVTPTNVSTINTTCMNALPEGIFYFKGQWKDAVGNLGAIAKASHIKDTTAPSAPTVGAPVIGPGNTAAVPVSGVAEAGSSVTVTASQGPTTATGSGTAGPSGAYAVTVNASAFTDGGVVLSAVATDPAGNTSPAGTGTTTKDTVAPVAPTSVAFVGTVAQGNAGAAEINVEGEAGTRANVSVDDTNPATLPVTGSGTLTGGKATIKLNLSGLTDGTLTARATLTDAGGNTGPARSGTALKDTVGPAAPSISSPDGGSLQRGSFTVSGLAEANARVELVKAGGTEVVGSGSSSPTGNWTIGVKLASGTHALRARARDDDYNAGALSAERIFDVDADLPTVTIDTPNYSLFTPGVPAVLTGAAADKPATVIGSVFAVEITAFDVRGEAVLQRNAVCEDCPVKTSVEWSFDAAALPSGFYTVEAVAIDGAGNRSAQPARTSFFKI